MSIVRGGVGVLRGMLLRRDDSYRSDYPRQIGLHELRYVRNSSRERDTVHYAYFEIENFKGARAVRLELSGSPTGDVFTLVGLNESGKTTVLEALSRFGPGSESTDPENDDDGTNPHDLMPISERDNFNGSVVVRAGIALTPEDQEDLEKHLRSKYYKVHSVPDEIRTETAIEFSQSTYRRHVEYWDFEIEGKTSSAKSVSTLKEGTKAWDEVCSFVQARVPRIRYFPDFLFQLPDRILIGRRHPEPPPDEDGQRGKRPDRLEGMSRHERFYIELLQDVLDSLDRGHTVDRHLYRRAISSKSSEQRNLKQLLNKVEWAITQTVLDGWDEMFGREGSAATQKRLVLTHETEKSDDGVVAHYLRWQIEQPSLGLSDIKELSLGFRWFFAYRLLTGYRGRRRDSPPLLFLFDEPASNLHSSAQSLLLSSFETLADDGNVILTTHSHHLINPHWLSRCYIVKNAGIDYTADVADYTARSSQITLHRYHQFANANPGETSYFQPILDTLDYRPSQLELADNAVLMEGKSDFYSMSYASLDASWRHGHLHLVPGIGSSALDTLIQLYVGWARNFVILLDSDGEGQLQRRRYIDRYGQILADRIFLLSDVKSKWTHSMEDLFLVTDKRKIQALVETDAGGDYNKKMFNRGLEEAVATRNFLGTVGGTSDNLDVLGDFLSSKLESLATT